MEDKELLFLDLCCRLPYGVIVNIEGYNTSKLKGIDGNTISTDRGINYPLKLVKPYLRPISSMTIDERFVYNGLCNETAVFDYEIISHKIYDWFNAHHLDYRGLIEKGLALPALEGMYD